MAALDSFGGAFRVALWIGLAGLSCKGAEEPGVLELLRFRQDGEASVYLNESLVLQFSEDLDQTSVTSATVRVKDADGRPARGELRIERSVVIFAPALPLSSDLGDGGFRPDTSYTVELAGFPRPDGLRSRTGEPLVSTRRLYFRTVGRDGELHLFHDLPSPRPSPLVVRAFDLGPLDPIVLECGEAVDPTSLVVGDFQLYRIDAGPEEPDTLGGEVSPVNRDEAEIALVPRLVENREDFARIELVAFGTSPGQRRILEEGSYLLTRSQNLALRNLGGRPIQVAWGGLVSRQLHVITQFARPLEVSFKSSSQRGVMAPPVSYDGTAYWPDRGAGVSLRYPAAAGDGRAGELELLSSPAAASAGQPLDLQATRLRIPAGAEVDLSALQGMVILRSQGALEIAGRLTRDTRPTTPSPSGLTEELLRALATQKRDTLTAWLARSGDTEEPWTVLIAGGDLRITGEVALGGPLVLIAGGWIRIEGRVDAEEVWKTPEGGHNVRARDHFQEIPLRIDPPVTNPLRIPLRAAVISVPLRPSRAVDSWELVSTTGAAGRGRYDIAFLGLKDNGEEIETFGPVDDISLLDGCAAVHVLVSLEIAPGPPGEAWDPPVVESVELRWSLRPALSPGANQAQPPAHPDRTGGPAPASPGRREESP